MRIKVLLFARAKQIAGSGDVTLTLAAGATVADLRAELVRTIPALGPLAPRLHVAINSDYAADTDAIPEGAEVACFPPVSGG